MAVDGDWQWMAIGIIWFFSEGKHFLLMGMLQSHVEDVNILEGNVGQKQSRECIFESIFLNLVPNTGI